MSALVDPSLKDLVEKKQTFWRNVVSLAEELGEVRRRLASQQQFVANETLVRREEDSKLERMEEEVRRIGKSLEEKSAQLEASVSVNEMYVKELDGLRVQLTATWAIADASAESAQSAQLQCLVLANELEEKNIYLKEHKTRVNKLGEQLDLLQRDLRATREFCQMQLKDEVSRIEHEIVKVLTMGGANKHQQAGPSGLKVIIGIFGKCLGF